MKNSLVKRCLRDTFPVMTGYLVLGIGFGILMKTNGYGFLWAFLMSLFIYAGSMQYLAVGLLTGGASLVTFFVSTLMVNARHLFYGISMIDRYRNTGKKKPYLIFALTDETYSLVCKDIEGIEGEDIKKYYLLVSLFDQVYWVVGSAIGALLGAVITFDTKGIDFALTALFITVFTDQWLKTKNHLAAIIGVVMSVFCLVLFGSENFLIPTMGLILISLILMKKYATKEEA